jgi:hypothetical protein
LTQTADSVEQMRRELTQLQEQMKKKADDPFAIADEFGIRPQWIYRRNHKETKRILGLEDNAIDALIEQGALPPPIPLTRAGKAVGWWGWQLIAYVKRKAKEAEDRLKALSDPNRPKHKGGRPRKTGAQR